MQFYLKIVTNYKMVCTLFDFMNLLSTFYFSVYHINAGDTPPLISHNDHSTVSHYLHSESNESNMGAEVSYQDKSIECRSKAKNCGNRH